MTTHQFVTKIQKFTSVLSEDSHLVQVLGRLAGVYADAVGQVKNVFTKTDANQIFAATNAGRNQIQQQFSEAIRAGVSLRKLFAALGEFEVALNEFESDLNTDAGALLSEMRDRSSKFAAALERFSLPYGISEILEMITSASNLYATIVGARAVLQIACGNLVTTSEALKPNQQDLSLFFASPNDLQQFIDKLRALEIIYEELSHLADISVQQEPLEIVKIETGSFWANVRGNVKVIKLMTGLVVNSVHFLHRNFTREGKIASIPRNVESVESALKLSQELKAAGIETKEMNEHLRKAGIKVAKELNQLLLGEPVVEINGIEIALSEELQQKFLEEGKRLLITDGSTSPKANQRSETSPPSESTPDT